MTGLVEPGARLVPDFAYMPAISHAVEVAEAVEDRRLVAATEAAATAGFHAGLAEGLRQAAELILSLPPEARLGRSVALLRQQSEEVLRALHGGFGPKAANEAAAFPSPRSS